LEEKQMAVTATTGSTSTPATTTATPITRREAYYALTGKQGESSVDKLWKTTLATNGKVLGALKYFGSWLASFVSKDSCVGKAHAEDKAFAAKVNAGFKSDPKVQAVFNAKLGKVVEQAKKTVLSLPHADGQPSINVVAHDGRQVNAQAGNMNLFSRDVKDMTDSVMAMATAAGHVAPGSLIAYAEAMQDIVKDTTAGIAETDLCQQYKDAIVGYYVPQAMLSSVASTYAKTNLETITPESLSKFIMDMQETFDNILDGDVVGYEILNTLFQAKGREIPGLITKFSNPAYLQSAVADFRAGQDKIIADAMGRLAQLRGDNGYNGEISQAWQQFFGAKKEYVKALGEAVNAVGGTTLSDARKQEIDNIHHDDVDGLARLEAMEREFDALGGSTAGLLRALKKPEFAELSVRFHAALDTMTQAQEKKDALEKERIAIGGAMFNPEADGSFRMEGSKKVWIVDPNSIIGKAQQAQVDCEAELETKHKGLVDFWRQMQELAGKFKRDGQHPDHARKIAFMSSIQDDLAAALATTLA
jgi:hypothetical protein